MQATDSLGRATFHVIAPRDDVRPTERDVRWFKHLERHGPLSSSDLIALTSDTHRCKDTALRRLQALRAGGFLALPPQQQACQRAEFRPYVYDLAVGAQRFLKDNHLTDETVRPTGHWWHIHDTATFTARVDREAAARGCRYIPAHEILARSGATLAIPIGRKMLIPDQLFAIDYGGQFRAFMVEVDRGTEPMASARTRKSWRSSLTQYDHVFAEGLANRHYGLKAPIAVLWLHRTQRRHDRFLEVLARHRSESRRRQFSAVSDKEQMSFVGDGGQQLEVSKV